MSFDSYLNGPVNGVGCLRWLSRPDSRNRGVDDVSVLDDALNPAHPNEPFCFTAVLCSSVPETLELIKQIESHGPRAILASEGLINILEDQLTLYSSPVRP